MSINAPESGPPEIRSYLRFFLSGWGDLNSRPSVPQTGRTEHGLFHTGRNPRHDRALTTGGHRAHTAGGPDPDRNVTSRVTRDVWPVPCCDQRPTNGGHLQ